VSSKEGILGGREYVVVAHNPVNVGGMETYLPAQLALLLQRNKIILHLVAVSGNGTASVRTERVGRGIVIFYAAADLKDLEAIIERLARTGKVEKIISHSPWDESTDVSLSVGERTGVTVAVVYHGGSDPMRFEHVLNYSKK